MTAAVWENQKLGAVAGILVFAFLFYRFHQGLRDMLPSAVARAVVEGGAVLWLLAAVLLDAR